MEYEIYTAWYIHSEVTETKAWTTARCKENPLSSAFRLNSTNHYPLSQEQKKVTCKSWNHIRIIFSDYRLHTFHQFRKTKQNHVNFMKSGFFFFKWSSLFNILIWMFKVCIPVQFAIPYIPHATLFFLVGCPRKSIIIATKCFINLNFSSQ